MAKLKQFYYKKNRLNQLKGFYATAINGSVTKAAKESNLSQSTITLQIQSLERDVQTKLFNRSQSGLTLTKDGQILFEMASQSLQSLDSLYENFLDKKKQQKPQIVNIAAHHISISYLLPKYIKKFSIQHPEVKLGIKNINAKKALTALLEEEIDIAIYPNVKTGNEFLAHHFCSFDPVLITATSHPLSKLNKIGLDDIATYNTIRLNKESISLPLFESVYKEFNFFTNIEFEDADWEIVKNYVRMGIGVGFVSEICVNKKDKTLFNYNLRDYFPAMDYNVLLKNGKIQDKVVLDLVKTIVGDDKFDNIYKKLPIIS